MTADVVFDGWRQCVVCGEDDPAAPLGFACNGGYSPTLVCGPCFRYRADEIGPTLSRVMAAERAKA